MRDLDSLERQISELLRDHLHLAVPETDTDLFESAALDSLSLVELLVQLENEFGVKIPLDQLDLDNFRSITRIAKFVGGRVGAPSVADGQRELPRAVGADCSVKLR